MSVDVQNKLATLRERLDAACVAAGREPSEVQLVAVSKTKPGELVVAAHAAGQRHFGENYAQELRDKARDLPLDGVCWHYIGRLQSNKAKYIAPVAYRVHALETPKQARALAKRAPATLRCLLAVNIGAEESKGGVLPDQALDRVRELHAIEGIEMVGLMCLPPTRDDPEDVAPFFQAMADLAAEGRAQGLPLHELSMGMSSDFHVAVRYGATWVRVGTAIFGARS